MNKSERLKSSTYNHLIESFRCWFVSYLPLSKGLLIMVNIMTSDGELIMLMAHTIGSIGQVIKEASTLREKYSDEEALKEVTRIYDGYVAAVKNITSQN